MFPTLTLAIVSSQHLLGLGLQKLFESRETAQIIVKSHLSVTADALLAESQPDVFLLDMETEQDAIGAIRLIKELASKSKILLLSGLEDKQRMREAFECGVDGLILKIQPAGVMLAAIEALYPSTTNHASIRSRNVVGVGLEASSQGDTDPSAPPPAWLHGLTERQREIVGLIGQGFSNKDIADQLCISGSTVRHHLTGIFDKVGVPNRQKLLIHTQQVRFPPV